MSATTAAVPFWRAAGMTYIGYSNVCAALVRRCLKEPYKSDAASREKVHFSITKWTDGKQEKPNDDHVPETPPNEDDDHVPETPPNEDDDHVQETPPNEDDDHVPETWPNGDGDAT
ncbi:hypothetical protein ABZP36_029090 [Zizania latifolia]